MHTDAHILCIYQVQYIYGWHTRHYSRVIRNSCLYYCLTDSRHLTGSLLLQHSEISSYFQCIALCWLHIARIVIKSSLTGGYKLICEERESIIIMLLSLVKSYTKLIWHGHSHSPPNTYTSILYAPFVLFDLTMCQTMPQYCLTNMILDQSQINVSWQTIIIVSDTAMTIKYIQ